MNEAVVTPLEQNEHGEMLPGRLPGKLPPTPEELMGNDMIWLIAKLCHELNRAYCAQICGDFSHRQWNETLPELRKSIYEGVMRVYEQPSITPEELHAAWMHSKLEDGWVFGNVKNVEQKTHPNLIPFEQLHLHERFKDIMFITTCKVMFGEEK